MKALRVATVALGLAVIAVPVVAAGHAAAEAAIQKVLQQFSDTWASGDAHARAALWAEDASLINPFGLEARGRAAIEKVFEQEDAGFAKGTTQTFSDFSYRFLTPTIAEVDTTGTIKGMKSADGTPMPPVTVHVFGIFTKTGGKWQMKDVRPYLIAKPPGTAPAGAK